MQKFTVAVLSNDQSSTTSWLKGHWESHLIVDNVPSLLEKSAGSQEKKTVWSLCCGSHNSSFPKSSSSTSLRSMSSSTGSSPSLPSQGSLSTMVGKAPPPTGAVEPRPKESSLGEKWPKHTHTFIMDCWCRRINNFKNNSLPTLFMPRHFFFLAAVHSWETPREHYLFNHGQHYNQIQHSQLSPLHQIQSVAISKFLKIAEHLLKYKLST